MSAFTSKPFDQVDIAIPEVFVGGLLGAMLVFLFSAWACKAVGRSAQEVVKEVRRQFQEKPGIMTYQDKPDHGRCVSIVAASALREMVAPGQPQSMFSPCGSLRLVACCCAQGCGAPAWSGLHGQGCMVSAASAC